MFAVTRAGSSLASFFSTRVGNGRPRVHDARTGLARDIEPRVVRIRPERLQVFLARGGGHRRGRARRGRARTRDDPRGLACDRARREHARGDVSVPVDVVKRYFLGRKPETSQQRRREFIVINDEFSEQAPPSRRARTVCDVARVVTRRPRHRGARVRRARRERTDASARRAVVRRVAALRARASPSTSRLDAVPVGRPSPGPPRVAGRGRRPAPLRVSARAGLRVQGEARRPREIRASARRARDRSRVRGSASRQRKEPPRRGRHAGPPLKDATTAVGARRAPRPVRLRARRRVRGERRVAEDHPGRARCGDQEPDHPGQPESSAPGFSCATRRRLRASGETQNFKTTGGDCRNLVAKQLATLFAAVGVPSEFQWGEGD